MKAFIMAPIAYADCLFNPARDYQYASLCEEPDVQNNYKACVYEYGYYCYWRGPTSTSTTSTRVTMTTQSTVYPLPIPNTLIMLGTKVTYITRVKHLWPKFKNDKLTLYDFGVPWVNPSMDGQPYNTVNIGYWLFEQGPINAARLLYEPNKYFLTGGMTRREWMRQFIGVYHYAGIRALISAFGPSAPTNPDDWPDADKTCGDLADFAKTNYYDGIDLAYECDSCMAQAQGAEWLINCTRAIRKKHPPEGGFLLSHAPQAKYFSKDLYPPKKYLGYLYVHEAVGHLIDWYNIKYYNQGNSTYDTCDSLLTESNGDATHTAVDQIVKEGVAIDKIVIGKPVTDNQHTTGYMPAPAFGNCLTKTKRNRKNYMLWEFADDTNCAFAGKSISDFLVPSGLE